MGDATEGIKCPQRHAKGCPGKLNAISTALQRQKFTSWEDCNHSSMSVDLCWRKHLLEDSDVLLDTQLKPLSQPLVLPLNLSWAMRLAPSVSICNSSWGLQSSSTHTHTPHPGTWCFYRRSHSRRKPLKHPQGESCNLGPLWSYSPFAWCCNM